MRRTRSFQIVLECMQRITSITRPVSSYHVILLSADNWFTLLMERFLRFFFESWVTLAAIEALFPFST